MPQYLKVIILALTVGLAAAGAEPAPKLKGSRKESAPKIDLGLSFDPLPTTPKLERASDTPSSSVPRQADTEQTYTVVSVTHAKAFTRGAKGSVADRALTSINASGKPLLTEKFSSLFRVRSAEARNVSIEVAIHDLRGDTVMAANGRLAFKGNDEQEWLVDWEPTGIRVGGDYEVHVRVGGHTQGPYPLKVIAASP
ncbi:MAG: hypothetical protein JNG84_03630 [Archangium sp.]|nr:hypothetical protein [Archangium sp.]